MSQKTDTKINPTNRGSYQTEGTKKIQNISIGKGKAVVNMRDGTKHTEACKEDMFGEELVNYIEQLTIKYERQTNSADTTN